MMDSIRIWGNAGNGGSGSGGGDDKCELLGPFALFVQAVMGVLVVGSLVWKRSHEYPNRRPWKIWMFDVSKQVIGASFVHILNLFLSIISKLAPKLFVITGNDVVYLTRKRIVDNPCDYYFLNLLFDTTVGIPVLYMLILLLTGLGEKLRVRGLESGEYGNPPRWGNYMKQLVVYLVALGLMKVAIYATMVVFPVLVTIAIWLLSRLDKYPSVQEGFVLLVFPLIMNVFQYYVVDNLIQGQEYYVYNYTHQGETRDSCRSHTDYGSV